MDMKSYMLLMMMLLVYYGSKEVNGNRTLTIAVFDIRSNMDNQSKWDYHITGDDGQNFAAVHWTEISTNIEDIPEVKPMFDLEYDVWLFTSRLCEESFFFEKVVPKNVSYSCVVPLTTAPSHSELAPSCYLRPSVKVGDSFCRYPYNSLRSVNIVASIIKELKWNNVILLYDQDSQHMTSDLTALVEGVTVLLYDMDEMTTNQSYIDLFYTIYNITEYTSRNFILMCHQSCINTVLYQADKFDDGNRGATALQIFSKWLVIDLDGKTVIESGCTLRIDNIAVVHLPETLTQINKNMYVNNIKANTNKLAIQNEGREDMMEIIFESLKNDLTRLSDCWRAEIYTLLYKREGRVLSRVGHVNYTHHVNLYPDVSIFPNTKFGFNQRVFKATTNHWEPFSKRLPSINGTVQYTGYSFDIMEVMEKSLNFSYTLKEPDDGEWGRFIKGSWTGVVGDLERREAEIFVGSITVTEPREQAIDFTVSYYLAYSAVVFRLPDPNRNKWRKLVEPFTWQVYVCLAAAFCFVIMLLFTMESVNPFYKNSKRKRPPTVQQTMLYLFGALLSQGGPRLSYSSSGRCLVACWWIFCLISVASYSGNLIASLTVAKEDLPFETLKELGSQDEYKWGTLQDAVWFSMFKESNLSDYKRLWQGIVRFNETDPDVIHGDQGLHRHKVATENYGFIGDLATAESWSIESCELTTLKELFYPMGYAFALQNNSPYLQIFNDEIMKLMESGVVDILQRKWWPTPGACAESSTQAKTIELVDIQSAFYVIVIGIAAASLTMAIESLFQKNGDEITLRNSFCRSRK